MLKHVVPPSNVDALNQPSVYPLLGPERAEAVADALYEIGKDLFHRKQYDAAVDWLNCSLHSLETAESEGLRPDAAELKLSILSYSGKSVSNKSSKI